MRHWGIIYIHTKQKWWRQQINWACMGQPNLLPHLCELQAPLIQTCVQSLAREHITWSIKELIISTSVMSDPTRLLLYMASFETKEVFLVHLCAVLVWSIISLLWLTIESASPITLQLRRAIHLLPISNSLQQLSATSCHHFLPASKPTQMASESWTKSTSHQSWISHWKSSYCITCTFLGETITFKRRRTGNIYHIKQNTMWERF